MTSPPRPVQPWLAAALALAAGLAAAAATPPRPAQTAYTPPPPARGDWRRLVPLDGAPGEADRARLRKLAGVDWDKLRSAWDYDAEAPGSTALLVVRHGWIVGEWYRDAGIDKTFNIYSSSKAYTSTAFGILLAERAARRTRPELTLETRVYGRDWLPEGLPPSDPRKEAITLRHLLTMTSGIASHVDTGPRPPGTGMYEFALGKDPAWKTARLAADPGTKYIYSNPGVSHLVMIHHRASGEDLRDYMKKRLFDRIGITHHEWLTDGGGGIGPFRQGYSGLLTTARDHARFLYLALHRGRWGGARVVPEDYYGWALAPGVNPEYGALWWRNRVAGTPPDTYQTGGARNNHGWVIPSLDLIVVRLGEGEKYPQDFSVELLRRVQAALIDQGGASH